MDFAEYGLACVHSVYGVLVFWHRYLPLDVFLSVFFPPALNTLHFRLERFAFGFQVCPF